MPTSLSEAAQGRWRGILPALGMPAVLLNGRHGPCPVCGGKDRFRFDDKEGRGTWFCNQCGAGDGIALVMHMQRLDFRSAAERIEPLIGITPLSSTRAAPTDEDCRRWRNEVWRGARPVTAEDTVGRYLHARASVSSFPSALRFHSKLEHRSTTGTTLHPAMLAMVTDADGRPANVHRTYLAPGARKANVNQPRMMMPGRVPEGSAIRLFDAGEVLGIAEGIETAFAAAALFAIPCWSAVNATLLSKWRPPPGVARVIIFGDNDANFAGQHAAFQLANRLAVRDRLSCEVRTPDRAGTDWADIFAEQAKAGTS